MAVDLNELRKDCDARLAAEAKKAAEEKAAAAARAKKQKKIAFIAVAVIAVGCLLKWVVIPTVKYNQAVSLLKSGQYDEAASAFEAMDGYKDSAAMIIETNYQKYVALMNAGDYDAAIAGFKELAEIEKSNAEAEKSTEVPVAYDTPAEESPSSSTKSFAERYGRLEQYGSYRDDVAECIYRMGVEAFDAGSYDEAMAAFEATDGYKDSAEQIAACETAILDGRYNDAVALMDAGQYEEAIAAFEALDGYKDSTVQIAEYKRLTLKNPQIGDYVFFGTYEQDNNKSNGKEDIEWLVLEIKDGKALVISKHALDCQQYNPEWTFVTWETCSLRQWLNKDFLNAAFSAEEQAMIPTVTVPADKNPSYSTDPGKATQDKVFLLSIQEANKYFSSDSARQCAATDYAVANGAYVNSDNGNCWWWLRSPGIIQVYAAYVVSGGGLLESGSSVSFSSDAVRPAMWIDLNAQ